MGSDEADLIRLWREKRGEVEPEDLNDNLIVQLGRVTEDLNRRWYERNTGHVIKDVQKHIQHPVNKWMAATLDGMVEPSGAVFEAKFMLPWTFSEQAAAEKHKAELKKLVPEDAKEALGHGLRAKRSKSGAISFDVMANAPLQ